MSQFETYIVDGEYYCDQCIDDPNGEGVDILQGEVDSPVNCCVCHRFCDCSFTTDGIEYIAEQVRETLSNGSNEWNLIHDAYKDTYYEGSRYVEIVRDWVKSLSCYCLPYRNGRRRTLFDVFLLVTEEGHQIGESEQSLLNSFLELYDSGETDAD